jgi:cobalt/nickel transport system permease protein
MHIPDSILSPATSAVMGIAMLPVWAMAGQRVRAGLKTRQVPLLALGAAFCFTVMMFNIPALGGTTAHPVAGTLLAILLGPWAAVIGVSVALAIQALFFGDGGLLAYGANCFTMAFVLPFVGYSVYRLLSGRLKSTSSANAFCAAVGAYVGLNAAAAVVAVLLGIQPALFHEPNGQPLYFPFGLAITLPAMLSTHLLIAGPAEAVVTALVVGYLRTARIPLYDREDRGYAAPARSSRLAGSDDDSRNERDRGALAGTSGRRREALWIGLLALLALSPLGLLAKGEAWGEWDTEGLKAQIEKVEGKEYVPKGVAQAQAHSYKGVRGLSDYASDRGAKGYLAAAVIGVGAILTLLLLGGRVLANRDEDAAHIGGKEEERDERRPPGDRTNESPAAASSPSLPGWMQRPSEETAPPPDSSGRPPNRFLERTVGEIAAGTAVTLYGERWARQPGYLQQLDPRAKVLSFLGLIAVVTAIHNAVTLLALSLLTVVLAGVSRLPVGLLLKRVWLSVPLFVGAISLPAALNVVTPGREIWVFWPHPHLAITAPGLGAALLLMLRVGVSVSLATLLTLTTGWNDLLRALRMLFVPRLFIGVLAMTYRYVAVLLQTAGEMFVARRSRTVGRATNTGGRQFVGTSIGALFGKTMALSEEVHAAMLSRGFNGEMQTLTRLHWRLADSLWTLAILLVAMLALGGEYASHVH